MAGLDSSWNEMKQDQKLPMKYAQKIMDALKNAFVRSSSTHGQRDRYPCAHKAHIRILLLLIAEMAER
jgi:hypothetical protein